MKRACNRGARTGASLIEILIAITMTAVVLGAVVQSTNRGMGAFRVGSANNEIDSRVGRLASRLTRELLGASSGNLAPDLTTPVGLPTVWSSTLDFQVGEAWDGAGVVWSEQRRLAWELAPGELANGLDDNRDGLADEGVLVFTQDPGGPQELRVTLASGLREFLEGETPNGLDDNGNGLVDESGLSFELAGDVLTVRFSLERIGPDQLPIVRTQAFSIRLRNSAP